MKNDLISRAAVIEAVHNEFDGCLVWDESGEATANEVERIIASLPSEAPDGPDNLVKDSQGLVKDLVNDCISRQAAINALDKRFDSIPMEQTTEILQLRKDLRELPSAQPETHDKRAEMHACDLISRAEAIDATWFEPSYTDPLNVLTEVRDRLKVLPSIPPERKRGKWLPDNNPGGGFWVCSCCKFPSEAFAADKLYKYCPVCGCRMDEGD